MPPNPFENLGLPATWAPTAPHDWRLGKCEMRGPAGAVTIHVLVFDTPSGRIDVPLDDNGARSLIDQLSEQVSGIVTATAMPPGGLLRA